MAPKIVLITGCSSGIGLAAAVHLAQDASKGYLVYASMRNLAKKGDLVTAAGNTLDKTLFIIQLDVTQEESIQAAVKTIIDKHKRIDVCVNNAGHGSSGYIELITMEQMKQLFDVNFFGMVRLTQEVLPYMKKQRSGRIINISSVSGITAWPFGEIYAASKFALEGFTESLASGVRPFNIWVSSVQPGPVRTSFIANMGEVNNQPDFAKVADDPRADPASREVFSMTIKHLLGGGSNFENETQDAIDLAIVIKGIIDAAKPHLRNPTSEFRLEYAKKYFTDPTGDTFLNTIVPFITPESMKPKK